MLREELIQTWTNLKERLTSWKDGKVTVYRNFAVPQKIALTPEEMETRKTGKLFCSALREYEKYLLAKLNILSQKDSSQVKQQIEEYQTELEFCRSHITTMEIGLEVMEWEKNAKFKEEEKDNPTITDDN